ncbi:MAG: family efflux transporter [Labilithrix sp.]|nr:family efflux transporter [Labilithrix sp.]
MTIVASPKPARARPNLTEGAVGKTLFVFSLPILFSNVLQSLNGSINSIWVGRYLGSAALTATSNANTLMFFLIGMVFGVGMATAILVGQAIGAQDALQAKRVVGTSATFFVAVSLFVSVFGFLASPQLLTWMRTPPDALPFAVAYLRVIFVAMPFIICFAFITIVLRGSGDARTPLTFSFISVGLDIVLNPVLIFGLGPFPKLGVAGAATATLVANVTALTAILITLYRRNHPLTLRGAELGFLRIDRTILRALVTKGLPMGLQMIVLSSSAIVMFAIVNGYGTASAAAYGASLQLWNYIQMPALAIGMAASAMAAQNVGAGRFDRVGEVAKSGVRINLMLTGSLALIVYVLGRQSLSLFLTDPEPIRIGMHLNAIAVWSFVLFGVSMVLGSVVRSTGAVVPPLVILFISYWLLRIPFAVLMTRAIGIDGIWWSFPLGSLAALVLSVAYYRYGGWRTAKMLG